MAEVVLDRLDQSPVATSGWSRRSCSVYAAVLHQAQRRCVLSSHGCHMRAEAPDQVLHDDHVDEGDAQGRAGVAHQVGQPEAEQRRR